MFSKQCSHSFQDGYEYTENTANIEIVKEEENCLAKVKVEQADFSEEVNITYGNAFTATAVSQPNDHFEVILDGSIDDMKFECVSIVRNGIQFKMKICYANDSFTQISLGGF